MNWKQYQNELIVLIAFVLMLGGYLYKSNQASSQSANTQTTQKSIEELKEVLALQKIWKDKKIKTKVSKLQSVIPSGKVKWNKKGNKLIASYKALSSNEVNKLTTKILNLPVEVQLLDIKKTGSTYNVEFKCKW